jgi:hypothetical protein
MMRQLRCIGFTLTKDEESILCWWAAKHAKTPSTVLHDALWGYFRCVRSEYERERDQGRIPPVKPASDRERRNPTPARQRSQRPK